MERKIKQQVASYRTKDEAGMSMVRMLGNTLVYVYNPVLIVSISTKGLVEQ